jgi:hypothetical protein
MEHAILISKLYFLLRIAHPILLLREFLSSMQREKKYMLAEMAKVAGLLPLLMKPRNGEKWTAQDRLELMGHLKRLSHLSRYIAAVLVPGGFVMLPVFVWWLDRRRSRRLPKAA